MPGDLSEYWDPRNIHSTSTTDMTPGNEWSVITRAILMVIGCLLGIIINVGFILVLTTRSNLWTHEYVLQLLLALAEALITIGVILSSTITTIFDSLDSLQGCRALQYIGLMCTYCYSIFFLIIGCESYLRLCRHQTRHDSFVGFGIACMAVIVLILSNLLAAVGIFLNLDYDYCRVHQYGNTFYKRTTFVLFHALPSVVTVTTLVTGSLHIRRLKRTLSQDEDNSERNDLSLTYLNLVVYLLYVLTWMPYITITNMYPKTDVQIIYYSLWLGLSHSVFSNAIYCIFNETYRRACIDLLCHLGNKSSRGHDDDNKPNSDFESNDMEARISEEGINIQVSLQQASVQREVLDF